MATRVYLGTLGAGVLQDASGNVLGGQAATIKVMSTGVNATHYSARTGGTSSTASITTSSTGTLERWVDPGEYTITVGSNTYDFHAKPGKQSALPWVINLFGPENRAAEALQCLTTASYGFQGSALSASTAPLMSGWNFTVLGCLWELIWTPNATGCGVELVNADPGPTNIVQMAEFTGNASVTPVNSSVFISASTIQALIDFNAAGVIGGANNKTIAYRAKGNGSVGPLIYVCRVTIIVEL